MRLDLFRGLALWLIYLDHIPSNIVAWVTIRNYGFSDATEIFIFISGYTAAFVYGRAMRDYGFVVSSARILKRAWQIYVAHIFLFAIYLAEIAYVARGFQNPLYAEEMNMLDFLQQPDVTILQALLLKFKPVNMDVLPLYIVLMTLFAPVLWLLLRNATLALAALGRALCRDLGVRLEHAGLSERHWYFNPFAWQLLFVFGAWCALGGAERLSGLLRSRIGACDCDRLSRLCIPDHADLAYSAAGAASFRNGSPSRSIRSTRPIWTSCVSRISSRLPRSPSISSRATGRRCARIGLGPPSCAGSIRWKSSVLACSWPLPPISPRSRYLPEFPCRFWSACLGL